MTSTSEQDIHAIFVRAIAEDPFLPAVDADFAQAVLDVAAEINATMIWRQRLRNAIAGVCERVAILRHRRRGA